jgi:acyl carrier protein
VLNAELIEIVSSTAREMNLLNERGELVVVDSLTAVDFAMALEIKLGRHFPTKHLTTDTFRSVNDVVAALAA